jgi:hypothetical protein
MLDLFRIYGQDTVETVFPKPGSKKWEQSSNIPWDKYKAPKSLEEGSTSDRSWYVDFIEASNRGKRLIAERESIKASAKGTDGVMPEHGHLVGDKKRRAVAMAAIQGKMNNAKQAIIRAVNLAHKLAFVNAHTEMEAILMTEDDGTPVASNKLIYIEDKTKKTQSDVVTIGQFLAYKVTDGATYNAIVGTTTRAAGSGTGPQAEPEINVNTLTQFDKVTAAYATFIDKMNEAIAKKDMKAYNAFLTHLNADNSGDLLLSLNSIMGFLDGILSKPALSRRLADLLAKEKKQTDSEKKTAA